MSFISQAERMEPESTRPAAHADIDEVAALVKRPDAWASLGLLLLGDLAQAARGRGAVQVVVVAGRHDEPKRKALKAAGLVVASEWWTKPISLACRGARTDEPH